ncbi:MAG: hypothetical protein ACO1QS_12665 [Verrucomicrobiota bacterium]
MKPRSNLPGLLAGIVFAVVIVMLAVQMDDGSQAQLWRSGLLGAAFIPLSIVVAELRSGHAWKNLAPGNRGVARKDAARRFWISVTWHTVFAAGLIAFAMLARLPK